jgi:hypothetical protein
MHRQRLEHRTGRQADWGYILSPANTDVVYRASRYSYGEATGITQTARNYDVSLGFALLGMILLSRFRTAITASLVCKGVPRPAAAAQAARIAQRQGGHGTIPLFIRIQLRRRHDVLYTMAVVMAAVALALLRGLRREVPGRRADSRPDTRYQHNQ